MKPKYPTIEKLESGDILWRRDIDQILLLRDEVGLRAVDPAASPTDARPAAAEDATPTVWEHVPDADEWQRAKAELILALAKDPAWQLDERLERLHALERPGLRWSSEGSSTRSRPMEFNTISRRYYIGHPSIVHRLGDELWMIDATWTRRGVHCQPYADWVSDMPNARHWHGRLKDHSRQQRAKIADAALAIHALQPRPTYSLWEPAAFDMLDMTSTYCSKLVWTAVHEALGISIDDQPAQRFWWLTPRQTYECDAFEKLAGPDQRY